jgi:hypothetical protein
MLKAKLKAILPLFLVANSLSWFTLTMVTIMDISGSTAYDRIFAISGSYFAALLFSALVGATLLAQKMKQRSFVSIWTLSGVITCLLFYFQASTNAPLFILGILSLILGGSVGLGIPMCLSLFANQTKNERMGRIGAGIFFIIQILTAAFLFLLDGMDTEIKFLFFSIWRILGLIGIIYLSEIKTDVQEKKTPLSKILKDRTFILYFLPWFMFTLINFVQTPIVEGYMGPAFYSNYLVAALIITSFTAIGAGFLCDYKGRKLAGIVGFILLGLGYAFLSFLGNNYKLLAVNLFTVFDGLAWGFLYVTFIFVVWGDLSEKNNREKYYLLGGLPYLLSGLIQVLVKPLVESITDITIIFSFASFFLFIATLPLLYAPESLSDKLMKSRELFNYVNKALKKVQKEKEKPLEQNEEKDEDEIEAEETPQDVEARKLAEKYY